jgi:acid phosphatase family membrane protein YuiD
MLFLELLILVIIVWLSQFMEIASIGFSTTGKSNRKSWSHSALVPALSKAVSSASTVDFVKIVIGHLFSIVVWNQKQGNTMLKGKDLHP